VTAHSVPSIVSHHPSQSVSADDGHVNSLDVTVVLPCYNEQDHVSDELERIAKALDASDFSYELLIIDDKSTDNTLAVLREELPHYPHMRLMPFRRNGGSGQGTISHSVCERSAELGIQVPQSIHSGGSAGADGFVDPGGAAGTEV